MVLMGMSTVGVVSGGVVSAPADVAPVGVIMVFAAQYTSLALKNHKCKCDLASLFLIVTINTIVMMGWQTKVGWSKRNDATAK